MLKRKKEQGQKQRQFVLTLENFMANRYAGTQLNERRDNTVEEVSAIFDELEDTDIQAVTSFINEIDLDVNDFTMKGEDEASRLGFDKLWAGSVKKEVPGVGKITFGRRKLVGLKDGEIYTLNTDKSKKWEKLTAEAEG